MTEDQRPTDHDQDSEPGSAPAGAAAASDTSSVPGDESTDQDAGPASVPAGAARPAEDDHPEQGGESGEVAGD